MGRIFSSIDAVKKASGMIATSSKHTVAVCADGTVLATGSNWHKQCKVADWSYIVSIAAGRKMTAGVRADGTVALVGKNADRISREVKDWRDIVRVAISDYGVVGLKSNGVAIRSNDERPLTNVEMIGSQWSDVSVVSKSGNIINTGVADPVLAQAVLKWKGIVALAAGTSHVIGLQSTGTIMCAWLEDDYYCGQCDTDNWRDIVAIAVGSDHSVGLRSDGRVFACGLNDCGQTNVGHWKDIIAIAAYGRHTIGLRADGIVVATGENKHGQCNIGGWKLFDDFRRISSQYDISCFGGS